MPIDLTPLAIIGAGILLGLLVMVLTLVWKPARRPPIVRRAKPPQARPPAPPPSPSSTDAVRRHGDRNSGAP